MKSLLLLILSMVAGCEAEFDVKACLHGWVQFSCKYPDTNKTYEDISVAVSNRTTARSPQKDEWKKKSRFSLYHDMKNQNLKVAVKNIEQTDFEEYKCEFYHSSNSSDVQKGKLQKEDKSCQQTFHQIAHRHDETTITCDHPDSEHKSFHAFFCKEKRSICEDILSTESSQKSKYKFTPTNSNHGFSISISHLSPQDSGIYWCGVESDDGSYRFSLKQIKLEVKNFRNFRRKAAIGQNFTYWCKYDLFENVSLFICKGEDPSTCQPVLSTAESPVNTRFFMNNNKTTKNATITVREVTANDSGTYWCGAKSNNNQTNSTIFHRLSLTVESAPAATQSPGSSSRSEVVTVVIICVTLLLLMLLLFVMGLILIYQRFSRSRDIRIGAAAAGHIKEDNIYEEIEECHQNQESETTAKTVYLTLGAPTNHSASLHYSAINFQSSRDKARAEATTLTPKSPAYKYSAVEFSRYPAKSTGTQRSRWTEELL